MDDELFRREQQVRIIHSYIKCRENSKIHFETDPVRASAERLEGKDVTELVYSHLCTKIPDENCPSVSVQREIANGRL